MYNSTVELPSLLLSPQISCDAFCPSRSRKSFVLQAYRGLSEKHTLLSVEYRKLLEERGDSIADAADELLMLREQLAVMSSKYDASCDQAAELK